MRIAIDVRALVDGRLTGVEIYTRRIVEALMEAGPGHEFHLFYNRMQRPCLPVMRDGIVWHKFRFPNKGLMAVQGTVGWPYWDKLVRADVFFVPNLNVLPVHDTVPLVVTAHDLSFERFPDFFSWRHRLWHKWVRPRRLMERADRVIAVSASTARDVSSLYGIAQERIKVIHSGVSMTGLSTRIASRLRPEIKQKLPASFVLFLAAREPRKNIVSLVEAFAEVADRVQQDLVIAGSPGWMQEYLDRAIAKSRVSKRIYMIGLVKEAEKMALYEAADLFVYPSFYEGFGFPPLESLLAGTPVITSYNASLPEVAGSWVTMIDPYQPGEMADALLECLLWPRTVSEETRQLISARYQWARAGEATLRVLESVVS